MKGATTTILFLGILSYLPTGLCAAAPADTEAGVQALLEKMTLPEKVGQMTQITLEVVAGEQKDGWVNLDPNKLHNVIVKHHVGSLLNCAGQARTGKNWQAILEQIQNVATKQTRLGIPVIYGIDSIHGANYILGATLFPQSIAMAATGNADLSYEEGRITAIETRATGIPWNFNPVLGLGRDPRWSRFWETFGEDSYLTAVLGAHYIAGQQGDDLTDSQRVAACMKHYLGYSVPRSGKDRTPAYIPERQLREYFLPPFAAAAKAGVVTVMVNSSEINGIPVHSSHTLLTKVLRQELGFKGFVVSDWEDVKNLFERERVAADYRAATKLAVMAGMDMCMVPYDFKFYDSLIDLVQQGEVPMTRIDQAVADILRVKFQLGLFEKPVAVKQDLERIGTKAARKINLQAAREALTLLKNQDAVLPLSKNTRVLVTGPCADKLSVLNGGWSTTWQGDKEELYPQDKPTVRQALTNMLGKDQVLYHQGVGFTEDSNSIQALALASRADAIIACMGEPTYCETPGNIDDLNMSAVQLSYLEKLAATGKPVVLVLIEGRPRVIAAVEEKMKAVLMAYLPGLEGGQAIAEVLFGDVNPSGKLPFSYPKHAGWHTTYDHKHSETMGGNRYDPQWPFGAGLSYTTFAYRDLAVGKQTLGLKDTLTVSVTVTNTGQRTGQEIVQLFVSDLVASVTPPVKRLRAFKKIELEPRQSQKVYFNLAISELAFIGRDLKPIVEPGDFEVHIGDQSQKFVVR